MSSIRLIFPLIFALQIFLAVGLTGVIAYMSQMKEARETAKEILDLIGDTMDEQLFQFLSTPVTLTEIYAEEIRKHPNQRFDDLLNPKQIRAAANAVWAQSRISRWVNLNLANPAGQSFRFDRKEYGKQILKLSDIRRGGVVHWYALDGYRQGDPPLEIQKLAYDPRQEAYFREAIERKQLILSRVHFSPLVRGSPVVTVAEPVFDPHDRLRVVVSSDIYLQGISSYLRGLRLPPYSVAFIFDPDGNLVASSELEEHPYGEKDQDRKLLGVLQSGTPEIRSTGEHLLHRFGGFNVAKNTSFQFITENQRTYVYATRLFSELGLDWNFAVVIAENGLIQNLLNGIYWTTLVSLLLLTLAILVGLWTAGWMIRPILTLGAVASALERNDLDERQLHVKQLEKDTRRRNEFGELAQTFQRMIREVRARHGLLETQLEQLRVGIDHEATRQQVEQIAETEFFRSLQEKTKQIRSQRSPPVNGVAVEEVVTEREF